MTAAFAKVLSAGAAGAEGAVGPAGPPATDGVAFFLGRVVFFAVAPAAPVVVVSVGPEPAAAFVGATLFLAESVDPAGGRPSAAAPLATDAAVSTAAFAGATLLLRGAADSWSCGLSADASARLRAVFFAATFVTGDLGSAGALTSAGVALPAFLAATFPVVLTAGPAFFAGVVFVAGISGSAGDPLSAAALGVAFLPALGLALLAGAAGCTRWFSGDAFLVGPGFFAGVRLVGGWRRLEGRSSLGVEPSTAGGAWNNTAGGFRRSSDAVRAGEGSGGLDGAVNAAFLAGDFPPVPPPSATMPRSLAGRATVRSH